MRLLVKHVAFIVGPPLVMVLASSTFTNFTIKLLWGWFLVPIGVPDLTSVSALGIALALTGMTCKIPDCKIEDGLFKMVAHSIRAAIDGPSMALLLGWIVHLLT